MSSVVLAQRDCLALAYCVGLALLATVFDRLRRRDRTAGWHVPAAAAVVLAVAAALETVAADTPAIATVSRLASGVAWLLAAAAAHDLWARHGRPPGWGWWGAALLLPAAGLTVADAAGTAGLAAMLLVARGLGPFAAVALAWHLEAQTPDGAPRPTLRRLCVAATLAVVLVAGWGATNARETALDARMRRGALHHATALAAGIDPERARALTFTPGDHDAAPFRELRRQMITYGRVLGLRSIYSMRLRDRRIVFGPENLPEGDAMASPPGTLYEQPAPEHWRVFASAAPAIFGPVTDEYGTFVSALAPVTDPRTGTVLMVVGVDAMADEWSASLAAERRATLLLVLALAALVVASDMLLDRRDELPPARQGILRHLEPVFAAALGLVITAVGAWAAGDGDRARQLREVAALADAETRAVIATLRALGTRLDALDEVERATPHATAAARDDAIAALRRQPLVRSLAWLPLRADAGSPAAPWHVAPGDQRSALRLAAHGGLPTASSADRFGDIVVFARTGGAAGGRPLGVLAVTLALGEPLRPPAGLAEDATVVASDLVDLDDESAVLASDAPDVDAGAAAPRLGEAAVHPVFAFGRAWATVARPRTAFFAARPLGDAATFGIVGLLLTVALVVFVQKRRHREHQLEHQVWERTQALQRSEERWHFALDAAGDGLWDWDLSTDGIHVSPRWRAMLGLGDGDATVTFEEWAARIHPEDRERTRAALTNHLTGTTPAFCVEQRVCGADGAYGWKLARGKVVARAADGEPRRLVGTVADVSELKRVQAAMAETNALLSGLLDSIPDVVVFTDREGRCLGCNHEAARLMGRPRSEIVGRTVYELFPAEVAKELQRGARRALETARPTTTEGRMHHPDGREVVASTLIAPLRDADGAVIGIVGVARDVTDVRQRSEQLADANRQLEEAVARANALALEAANASVAKSRFMANMSHEIRTPLNGVIGMSSVLLDSDLTPEQQHYAEIVRTSGEHLLSVLNDILDYSKIEAGKLELERLTFDLRELMEDAADAMALQAHRKGLELVCDVADDVPTTIVGDPDRLRQVLFNLMGNAIKFTHAGEVVVRVARVGGDDAAPLLRWRVEDTGVGIPQERLADLFTPFTQLDASTTRHYGGTGLGLAISKMLAELMGGGVGVESEVGRGSTFWFAAVVGVPDEAMTSRTPEEVKGRRVLVVDDSTSARAVLTRTLERAGCRVEAVGDAEAAVAAVHAAGAWGQSFDVVLLDTVLGTVATDELRRTMVADERLHDTRIVMLSPLGRRGEVARLTVAGCDVVITKPVKWAPLWRAMTSPCMPMTAPRAIRPARGSGVPGMATAAPRILVCDDDLVNRMVADALLRKLGYDCVQTVGSGAEAIAALEKAAFDVVFMDCQMPEMDGYQATAAIRDPASAVRRHDVVIVAMTANAMPGDREACLRAGMNDYVSKPVDPRSVGDVMRKWLPASGVPTPDTSANGTAAPAGDDGDAAAAGDFDHLALAERVDHDDALILAVLATFLRHAPDDVAAVRAAVERGDARAAGEAAHKLKGAAANLGGVAVSAVALRMQRAGEAGDLPQLEGLLPELMAAMERLDAAMRAYLARDSADADAPQA